MRRAAASTGGSRFREHAGRVAQNRCRQWAPVVGLVAALTGCGGSDEDRTELTVLAASSLTAAFDRLEARFEAAHPGIDVVLSYDSSAILAQQVIAGAPADLLATADTETMGQVVDAGMVDSEPTVFARNTLVIVTPADNPADIDAVDDLTGAAVAVCVPEAPCGAATQRLLDINEVALDPATEEDNVSSVLTKVTSGEVDAGIVYVTDARAAEDQVDTIQIPRSNEVINDDPIAVVDGTDEASAAREWIDLVVSPEGQRVLAGLGFRTTAGGT